MKDIIGTTFDSINDGIEKVSSPSVRAGSTVERAGRMLEEGVSPSVIALQMTENSPNKKTYTSSDVVTLGNVYEDSKTKVVLTAKQTRALINDQRGRIPNSENLVTQ
ncbi:conserved hypothetical protein [Vibrio crassostreae]|nr:conserved hypothetical protein [Vibrio crassostreae]CAK1939932.1 conserved hypothetical protein [Vibrio crassostreae]CAK1939959.1 conserved hypothetical protein [Vibrio crassostreae]CAK2282035.1 conserved hypothetical protein [Vibrio crassostreae]CAK2528045.1 conserved hypothetical protein [Vibrio crassostreae]